MTYSGSDDVTAPVQVVDINLAGDRASTSGCEAADFAGFTPGTSPSSTRHLLLPSQGRQRHGRRAPAP